ncbi:MAG: AEC family transporter [Alkalilacustris sp.]
MQALVEVILPVFLVIGFGYAAVRLGLFAESGADGLMKFTQGFAIPCLLFSAIATLDLSAVFRPELLAAFYIGATTGFLAGLFGARWIFGRSWEDAVAVGFVCLFSNSVLLGLPITERAYGAQALAANFAIIALHAPFCYLLGITVMEGVRNSGRGVLATMGRVGLSMARNGLMIGIALGFAVNVSGVAVPGVVQDALGFMIAAALPAALFGLGGVLVRYRPEGDLRIIAMVCAISLGLHPAVVWGLGSALALDTAQMRSAVLTAAMAPGVNAYIFASMYGRAMRVAASSVLAATAVSVLTVWGWLQLLP